jgi:hypothetical protein
MSEECRGPENSPGTGSEQANRGDRSKREGDLRKAERRTGPRRRGDRGNNWGGQIEYRQWKDRERRRLEGERRRASHERRQGERRGEQGDRRKEAPERRAWLNPRPHRSTDLDYRINNNDDRSVRAEGRGCVETSTRLERTVGEQRPPGPTTYTLQAPPHMTGNPSEAAPGSNSVQGFIEVGTKLWERLLRAFHRGSKLT